MKITELYMSYIWVKIIFFYDVDIKAGCVVFYAYYKYITIFFEISGTNVTFLFSQLHLFRENKSLQLNELWESCVNAWYSKNPSRISKSNIKQSNCLLGLGIRSKCL